ncbi:MAG: hypothetical protein WBW04_06745 [Nitrolancea sp.]
MPVPDRDELRRTAEEFARNVEQRSGHALTVDLPSLAVLDAFLSEWLDMASVYDAIDDRLVESLAFPLLCFVGECMVSGGRTSWHVDQSAGSTLPVLAVPSGKLLDLEGPVTAVLRRQVPPFFHRLALDLERPDPLGNAPS